MNWSYPVFLDLTGRRCLVIGNGWTAPGKIHGLLRAGARVTLLSDEAAPELQEVAARGAIQWERRDYRTGDLDGYFLAVSTHEDRSRNAPIGRDAARTNILFNAVDDPPHCGFAYPSIHRRGELAIAISTNGKCPAVAVRLRQRFEQEIGDEYGALVDILGEMRDEIARRVPEFARRKELWYRLVDSGALDRLRSGDAEGTRAALRTIIEEEAAHAVA